MNEGEQQQGGSAGSIGSPSSAVPTARSLLEAIVDGSPLAIFSVDLQGRVTSWNRGAEQVFGWHSEEVLGRYLPAVPDGARDEYDALRMGVLEGRPFSNVVVHRLRKDGSPVAVRVSSGPVRDATGRIIGAMAVSEDVTELVAAQEAARRQAELLETIVDNAPILMAFFEPTGAVRWVNRHWETTLGWTLEEVRNHPNILAEFYPEPSEIQRVLDFMQASEGRFADFRVTLRDGSRRDTRWANIRLKDGTIIGIGTDVTERRDAEEKLRGLFESDAVGILFGDIYGGIHRANDALLHLLGYSPDDPEVAHLRWSDITPPEFLPLDAAAIAEARARGACAPYEKQYIRKDGSRVWVLAGYTLLDPDRVHSAAFIVDIDARKRAEDEIAAGRAFYLGLLEDFPALVWRIDPNALCQYVNRTYAQFAGRDAEALLRERWTDLLHPDDREFFFGVTGPAIAQRVPFEVEARLRRYDGEYRWINTYGRPYSSPDGQFAGFIGAGWDVTEHRQVEQQLRLAQKMEAVGRLAGGVAHDFNNLLAVINGYADLAIQSLPKADPLARDLGEVLAAGQRAEALTRQLLAFSRRQILKPELLDLNELLAGMERLIARLIGEDVDVVLRFGGELGPVRADRSQLEQVVMNLVVNARDAMPEGGRLTLETRGVRDPDADGPGQVELAVTDTGQGIDAAIRDRLFEPFFTTKPPGKGTGLGLATVYGIVSQMEGRVEVESEAGQGSTFRIVLPRASAGRPSAREPERLGRSTGSETILLVEDDDSVRRLAERILRGAGYTVLPAANGGEALLLSEDHAHIDLVVSDVVMPRMNGLRLVERLRRDRPEMKVLLLSGYADHALFEREGPSSGAPLLDKPFTSDRLARKVREVLDSLTPEQTHERG